MENNVLDDDLIIRQENQPESPSFEKGKKRGTKIIAPENGAFSPWYYIRIFLCFFSLLSPIAIIIGIAGWLPTVGNYLFVLAGIGILAGFVVSPRDYFSSAWSGLCGAFTLGMGYLSALLSVWYIAFLLLIFILLMTLAGSVLAFFVCLICPAIGTIYHYVTEYADHSNKRNYIAISAGVLAAGLFAASAWGAAAIDGVVNADKLNATFQPSVIYQDYIGEFELAEEYPAEILDAPVSSDTSRFGYSRTNTYSFTQKSANIQYQYELTIVFEFIKNGEMNEWIIEDFTGRKTVVGHDTISCTYIGIGEYPGNPFALSSNYACSINLAPDNTGTGTLDVDQSHFEFTIGEKEPMSSGGYDIHLVFTLNEPLVCPGLFENTTYEELHCIFSLDDNTLVLTELNDKLVLTPKTN